MVSEQLKELIHLAVVPNDFDEEKRQIIYRRADKEGVTRQDVDELINQAFGKPAVPSFFKRFFLKRLIVNDTWMFIQRIESDGKEIKFSRDHEFFFFGKPVCETIPIKDILYFDVFSKIGFRKRAEFGSTESQFSIRLMSHVAHELKNFCISNRARFANSDVFLLKSATTKTHVTTQPILWISKKYIVRSHNCLIGTESRDIVKIRDIAFYCKSKGLINTEVYFGHYDQISVDLKSDVAEYLEQYCIKNGAKIGKKPLHTFVPVFSIMKYLNPSNWFRKEQIALTDEAIIYNTKSLMSTECAYLPYEKVKVAQYGRGLLGNSINLFGEQNIVTYYKYNRSECISIIKRMLDEHGVQPGGATIRYSWPWFRFLGADTIAITNEGLCMSAHEYEGGGKYRRRKTYYIPYGDIYHYEKFSWWFLWRTYYIYAAADNIRKDQKDGIDDIFKLRRMVFWCGLYDKLKHTQASQNKDLFHDFCNDDYKNYK